ncbi:putative RNA exonuclease Rex3 [Aspergillus stella-maris]|uniref:putative RNA exonuclease Rex3 n=1 Tax=Aspergillus stella-maris TaxID=1810926 RepID=UPI003CCE48C3
MFAPLGLFKDIPCPQGEQCNLIACIFSHGGFAQGPASEASTQQDETSEPARKKVKRDPLPETKEVSKDVQLPLPGSGRVTPIKKPAPSTGSARPAVKPVGTALKSTATPPKQKPSSAAPSAEKAGSSIPQRQAPKESLNPRMIPKAPANYNVRTAILKKLHTTLCSLNDQLKKDKGLKENCLILTPDELITMALDEEEKIAKDNPTVYSNIVKLRIVKLSKLSKDDWAKELKEYLNKKYYKMQPPQKTTSTPSKQSEPFTTNMTPEEEIAIAKHLITPLTGLEDYGYVTRPSTAEEISTAKRGVEDAKGWEQCERCRGRFQVFPGRNEEGLLTSGGTCTHHPGKPLYPPKKKTDNVTGTSREQYYSCCNQGVSESRGCTVGETHVFKVSETKRLASIMQFETTAENDNLDAGKTPISFDCEMGYTTLGLELIRLTAVTWPAGKKILDVLVRPLGEVLDLNSRFSGVFPEAFLNAIPYGTETSSSDPAKLQIVPSPSVARTLLFKHLTPSTPLIGHAIDNDLNATRIIHPTVIDTAILYPAPGGFPYRMSLRVLARRYLEREIQSAGAQGHDSAEDAIAAGDLVRVRGKEAWGRLKGLGVGVRAGEVVVPQGQETAVEEVLVNARKGAGIARGVKREAES